MKTLFFSYDVWDLVDNGFPKPIDQQAYQALPQATKDLLKKNRKKDAKALFFICQVMKVFFSKSINCHKIKASMGKFTNNIPRHKQGENSKITNS